MTLISSSIPNMIGGISQQAPSARPRNASKDELNTLPSVVSGSRKRPGFDWVAQFPGDADPTSRGVCHAFETSDGARFLLLVNKNSQNAIQATVIRSDGVSYEIDLSADDGYLSSAIGNLQDIFRFLTIGDTTFILNRSISPSAIPVPEDVGLMDYNADLQVTNLVDLPDANLTAVGHVAEITTIGEYRIVKRLSQFENDDGIRVPVNYWAPFIPSTDRTRQDPKKYATFFVKQAVHDTDYRLTVEFEDGTSAGSSYKTPKSIDAQDKPVDINTDMIAQGIATSYSGGGTATVIGSTVSVSASKPIKKVSFSDGFGDQACEAYGESVSQFTDLPPNEVEGRVVSIQEAVSTAEDDYFVEFRDGTWRETVGYGDRSELDPSTMPVTLVYDPVNDGFELKLHEWPGRTAGDRASNADPTFVGRTINAMFLYKGRMVFLSDENVILSETGFFENFYRTTLTQYLETDPIDIASASKRTSILYDGVAFDQSLVLFSDQAQFRLLSGDSLTPENVSVDQTTAFSVSRKCIPISVGPNVFFTSSGEGNSTYSKVFEYYVNPNTDQDDASAITAGVPRLIQGKIVQMKASANEDICAVLTDQPGGGLYVYRYYWNGAEKAMSAWTRWELQGAEDIISIDFFGDTLYAVIRDVSGELHLLKSNMQEGATEPGLDFLVHLDVKLTSNLLPTLYENELTRFRLPVHVPSGLRPVFVVNTENDLGYPVGYVLEASQVQDDLVYFPDDLRNIPGAIGFAFDTCYIFSPIYVRQSVGSGEVPAQSGRLQLRYLTVYFSQAVAFQAQVTPEGRKTYVSRYTGKTFSNDTSFLGDQPLTDGHFRFSCRGRGDTTEIKLINDSPFPSAFTSADWEGVYNSRSQRV